MGIVSGLAKTAVFTGVSAVIFYAGMSCEEKSQAAEAAKVPYEIVQTDSGYSVLEKATSIAQPLQADNFQLGSVEYRIKGLLSEASEERAKAVKMLEERLGGVYRR